MFSIWTVLLIIAIVGLAIKEDKESVTLEEFISDYDSDDEEL